MVTIFIIVIFLFFAPVNSDKHKKSTPVLDFTKSAVHVVQENLQFFSIKEEKIKFILYTKKYPKGYRLFRNNIKNLRNSGFDNSNPTKVLIHGYINNHISEAVQLPKNAYLSKGKYNILAVDWSEYAFPYLLAVRHAKSIGHVIGLMIVYLSKEGGLKPSNLHIIGHSLGSHIAGYAAEKIKTKPARITGLDPAAPIFGSNPSSERLGYEDANFVDIIHTSVPVLGITQNIGHVDFYPGGGKHQPRCQGFHVEEILGACDHSMSYVYFAETIKNGNRYPAVKCDSLKEAIDKQCKGQITALMGEYAFYGKPRGIHYVDLSQRSQIYFYTHSWSHFPTHKKLKKTNLSNQKFFLTNKTYES